MDARSSLRKNKNTFDFLRLLAAVAVLIGHSNLELRTDFAWGLFSVIDGVPMFFIMSGMLIYLSAARIWERTGSWRDFYWNRYLRVAPAIYVFAVLAPVALAAVGAITFSSLISRDLVIWLGSSLLLLPNYNPDIWASVGTGVINGPLYTIPAEVSFYLITPLLVWAAERFGFWKMMAVMIGLSLIGSALYYFSTSETLQSVLHHTFLQRAACFTTGIFWARYWGRVPVKWWIFLVCGAAYLALTLWADGWFYAAFKPVLISLPFSYVIVVVGYYGPRLLARLPRYIGDLSFATYIWHSLVINIALWLGLSGHWWMTGAVLATTVVIAYGSWHLVERPAQRFKRTSLRDASPLLPRATPSTAPTGQ